MNQQYVFNPYVRAWECPLLLCFSPFWSLVRSFSTHNLRWVDCEFFFEMMDFDDDHWMVCLKSGCGKHYEQRHNFLLHWKLASARRQGGRDNQDSRWNLWQSWWNLLTYKVDEISLSTKLIESSYLQSWWNRLNYKINVIFLSTKLKESSYPQSRWNIFYPQRRYSLMSQRWTLGQIFP